MSLTLRQPYAALLAAADETGKAANPDLLIIGGAIAQRLMIQQLLRLNLRKLLG